MLSDQASRGCAVSIISTLMQHASSHTASALNNFVAAPDTDAAIVKVVTAAALTILQFGLLSSRQVQLRMQQG